MALCKLIGAAQWALQAEGMLGSCSDLSANIVLENAPGGLVVAAKGRVHTNYPNRGHSH